ncbi:zinc finger BED domain-containing protein DAYSLEEPER-like isoform X1 [Syzygium oleosum]|uniref:zinc finger BED domain-containing protein DAYSLEEPER-like isoform X1 n=2 Tax=Syzygium oleosum TaxID=219896 RepID=UPI0024B89A60|nr:zinc finger BED domain-containing protein DAYSLEEPER-like isoform X1 [Syzygium oleosum]
MACPDPAKHGKMKTENFYKLHLVIWDAPSSMETDTTIVSEVDTTIIPQTDTTHVLETEAAILPETDAAILPETDAAILPETDATIIPETEHAIIPETDHATIPETDHATIPETEHAIIPETDHAIIPESDDAVIPETDMDFIPDSDMAIVPATPATPLDNEQAGSETQPNKRRRKKSIVWEHFTVETVGPGHTRACCKQCKKSFAYITGSKLAGTSHLKRHIALGICPVSRQRNQLLLPYTTPGSKSASAYGSATDPPKRRYRTAPAIANVPLDQERCSLEIAKMIIMHEYPLHIVEHPGFIDFVRTLNPHYNMVSFNTVQGDCVAIYLREKQRLLNLISTIPGRVNLTLDLRTSNQNLGYVFLTGHFIDSDWKVHRHILNVVMVPYPDSDHAFNQAVVACLSDWNLEGRLFTLTVDQSVSSEAVIANLRGLTSVKNPHLLNSQILIGSCYAHLLSGLAQDALGSMADTIKKIRDSVKYVRTSEAHEEKFDELKQQLQVPSTKDLLIDDQTRWDTTYHMLVAACELKEVFACFDASDPDYKLTPSMDDWKQVETLCSYLKILFDAANILTGPTYPTASTFFHEVSKLHLDLAHAATSQDPFVSNLIKPLQEKFDKYWRGCCLILAVAVVMDPRFKMKLVEFSFSRIFGEDAETWIRIVDDGIHDLFLDYFAPVLPLPEAPMENGTESIIKTELPDEGMPQEGVSHEELQHDGTVISFGDGLSDFDVYISEISSGQQTKSELDQYLEESLLPRVQDFDLLGWWKLNNLKYPILSKMAADVLSIPISTVDPDSVFDTQSMKIDSYRSSLRPVTLEALVCAKNWLQSGSSETSSAFVKAEV